ncbi:MAG: hypothetical protein COZ57_30145, partial [Armatimonadetes bacterium CG_4_8_14_3_um_filter_66_20]
MVELLVVISII